MAEAPSTQMLIENVRTSYLYVFQPYTGKDGKKNFTSHLIFGPDHPQFPAIVAMIKQAAANEFGAEWEVIYEQLKAQDKLCLHKGSINKPGVEAYAGKLFISANRKFDDGPPRIVHPDTTKPDITSASVKFAPYSGCIANAVVRFWAQNNEWGKRVNAQLMGLQWAADDKKLSSGGGVASKDEFKRVNVGDADAAVPTKPAANGDLF